ncbi:MULTISPECIES: porin [Olivibacter]|jgi:hypothetical protein|uniref:Porin n=1 Tax=Olivibacter oleidegradans TaxID=760123 RepID=A0ABV6HIK5_9SPHI|nr:MULTISPECIES: porin [Olivibacter]MDM8175931.1 porin [Olivibacter sp. 47]
MLPLNRSCIKALLLLGTFLCVQHVGAQLKRELPEMLRNDNGLLTNMIDTNTIFGRNIIKLYNQYSHIGFSGYMQPQFQISQTRGNDNIYQGGDWGAYSSNRFRLRRGRFRMDFSHYLDDGSPSVYFLFQFDGTERGVNIRDFWGRFYENKFKLFHFSAGMMARPFGHEVLYSSSYREAPERGRMSQILMKTERDLGFMVSLNPRRAESAMKWLTVDLGIYNGQGMSGTMEYDNRKDVIMRISSKKQKIGKSKVRIAGGVSGFWGGITSRNALIYKTRQENNLFIMRADSSANNIGKNAARNYVGADMQIILPNSKKGQTEFRFEYIRGLQTSTLGTSETPGSLPVDEQGNPVPLSTRLFDGGYFYFLQNIGSWNNVLIFKYDWYDPNKKINGDDVDPSKGFTKADIRYDTWGLGLLRYINDYMKVTLWYERPTNEKTKIAGYGNIDKEGIATLRMQFSF